jgi:dipeptidyl aminopeptidase/acylaminoacyl peptidase
LRFRLGTGFVGAFLLALGLAAPSHATFPGADGKIAFHSNRDGNFEIYAMEPDGSSQTRLTTNSAVDLTPSWSPDGAKIAFVSTRDSNLEIYTMNANGSGQSRITTSAFEEAQPDWSPDGTQLLFTTNRDGNYEIYKMNANGTGVVRLTNNAAVDAWAAWSPDGTKIAFQSNRDGDYDIYKMNADASGQTKLTTNTALDEYPNWNSRGSRIFYDSNVDGTGSDIWWTDLNGNATLWWGFDTGTTDYAPSPWPAGDYVQRYSAGTGANTDIHSYCQGACTGGRQLTNATGVDEFPDQQPVTHNYARPKGATPLNVPLVPAYELCNPNTPPNATHGGALNSLACVPPTPESNYLTVGTPNFNGAVANNTGSVKLDVVVGNPSTQQNEADLKITMSDTDVRCVGVSGGCTNGALSDYADDLRFDTTFRITDGANGGTGAGTVVDLPVRFSVPCATTAATTIGSTCSINTTVNTLFGPTAITESQRAIWQLTDIVRLYDGGADGVASTTGDNQLFQAGGVFIP